MEGDCAQIRSERTYQTFFRNSRNPSSRPSSRTPCAKEASNPSRNEKRRAENALVSGVQVRLGTVDPSCLESHAIYRACR